MKPAAAIASARRAGIRQQHWMFSLKIFSFHQMPVVSSNYWNMVYGNTPDEVMQDKEGLQIMHVLGKNMAWILHCLEAGKNAGVPNRQ